jgi:DNA-binding NtrC family response regulator
MAVQGAGTSSTKVLIVEDEEGLRFALRRYLQKSGYAICEASSCATAEEVFHAEHPTAVLLDLQLPDGEGIALLARLRAAQPDVLFFVLTGHGSIDLAVRAVKQGATEFFTKPIGMAELAAALRASLEARATALRASGVRRIASPLAEEGEARRGPTLGSSPPMRRLEEQLQRMERTDAPVLVLGETGTGKSMLARRIHNASARKNGPFVDLNCASLSKEFLEAELFGYERGAFTGAHAAKPGLFEAADGGTLFLDEIGDIDVAVQPKILKVLEEKRFRRMGEVKERVANVRLVAATHRDLGAAIAAGTFRSDLYYRISTLYVTLPALRDRGEDILTLAEGLLAHICAGRGAVPALSADARKALLEHTWPGNVRELRNVLERACLLQTGDTITARELEFDPKTRTPSETRTTTLEDVERQHIETALQRSGGRVEAAARQLGLARSTLYLKIKMYGLVLSKFQSAVPKTG